MYFLKFPLWVATRDSARARLVARLGPQLCCELSLACVSVSVCCVLWMAGWVFADGWELASVGVPRG